MNDRVEIYCHAEHDFEDDDGNYVISYCTLALGHRGKHAFQTVLDGL